MPDPQHHPIRVVARMTGLTLDTLRAWERRYEAVVPARGERGRLYTDRQVERLKQLALLVDRGHAIGSIASLSDAALRRLGAADPAAAAISPANSAANLDPLRHAISLYDLDAIDSFLARHAVVLAPDDFIFGIILPALRDVGARWETGDLCPAQEHLFSGVVRGVLGGLLRVMPHGRRSRPMVFATPAGDRHELGLLCGAVLAAWAGHAVIYLGPDLPSSDLLDAVKSSKATRVVLAATTTGGADADDLKGLRRLADAVTIYAGGPEAATLRQAIGARVRTFASLEDLHGWLDRDAH